jgi:hypothetical protein
MKQEKMKHPEALEECFKLLAEDWKIKCEERPCPAEIHYSKGLPAYQMWQACEDTMKFSKMRLRELLKENPLPTIPPERATSEETPFTFKRKKKLYVLQNSSLSEPPLFQIFPSVKEKDLVQ